MSGKLTTEQVKQTITTSEKGTTFKIENGNLLRQRNNSSQWETIGQVADMREADRLVRDESARVDGPNTERERAAAQRAPMNPPEEDPNRHNKHVTDRKAQPDLPEPPRPTAEQVIEETKQSQPGSGTLTQQIQHPPLSHTQELMAEYRQPELPKPAPVGPAAPPVPPKQ